MADRGIIFSAPMVRALLEGRKFQTRRIIKPPRCATLHGRSPLPDKSFFDRGLGDGCYLHFAYGGGDLGDDYCQERVRCPYGVPGDRLFVRETLREFELSIDRPDGGWYYGADGAEVELAANDPRVPQMVSWAHHKDRSVCVAIHMPRWASRITLEITGVRAERVQEISEADAEAEGVEPDFGNAHTCAGRDHSRSFMRLWDQINGAAAPWSSNCWVWVLEFRRVDAEAEAAQ